MSDDVLGQLVGRSPSRLLEDLAVIGRALVASDRARPEIEVLLIGGAIIRGCIVSHVEDRMGAVALVQRGGSPHAPTVSFVRVDQVAAVTIVDASLLVRAPIRDTPAPSRLELQRQVATQSAALVAKLGRALPIVVASELDDDSRRAVGIVMPVLFDVIAAIAGDDMGKAAFSAVDSIELGAASTAEVWKEGPGKLAVRASKLLIEAFTFGSLRSAIEKLL